MSSSGGESPPTGVASTSGVWEVASDESETDGRDIAGKGPDNNQDSDEEVRSNLDSDGSDKLDEIISDVVDKEYESDRDPVDDDARTVIRRDLEADYDDDATEARTEKQPDTPMPTTSRAPPTTCGKRERIKQALADYMRGNRIPPEGPTGPPKRPRSNKSGKFVRPDPFPIGVPHDARWSTWVDWKVQFEAALAVSGSLSQHEMANHLFLSVGSELRQIVNAYGMKPELSQVSRDYQFYNKLIEGLDKHFEGTSDATVDMKNLMALAQRDSESVRDFHVRLMLQARVCFKRNFVAGEYTSLLRNRLIDGLRDREVANMAFLNEWSVEKVVEVASRSETLQLSKKLLGEAKAITEVFEVKTEKPPLERRGEVGKPFQSRGYRGTDRYDRRGTAQSSRGSGSVNRERAWPCGDCGLPKHRFGSCPAIGRTCRECLKPGHFASVCKQRRDRDVNEVDASHGKQEPEVIGD